MSLMVISFLVIFGLLMIVFIVLQSRTATALVLEFF